MKVKYKLVSVLMALTFLLTSIPEAFFAKSFADSEEDMEVVDTIYLEDINEEYNLGLSEKELAEEEAVLQGAIIEGNKAYDIPLMRQAENDLRLLGEDRCIDMPGGINTYNPQQFFYIGSIGVRIQLLRKVHYFINLMTTEYIYKIQEAHNLAAQVAFEAVMVAINPLNGRKDVLEAIDKLDANFEKIISLRDMTSGDQATAYVKKLMYKNIREARRASTRFFEDDGYGTRGKEEFIQNIFKGEINDINKQVGLPITFGQLIELDARLKSAASSALLSAEVIANPKWLNKTVQGEINKQNRLKSKYRSKISKEDYDLWQGLVRKVIDKKVERNPRYKSVSESIYDLWDFNNDLLEKYPEVFTKDMFGEFSLYIPSSYIEPYQVAGISWIVSPTFDKIPAGMRAESSNVIIGFGGQKAQYGDYRSYVSHRSSLRDVVINTDMDGSDSDLIYPDFTNPN